MFESIFCTVAHVVLHVWWFVLTNWHQVCATCALVPRQPRWPPSNERQQRGRASTHPLLNNDQGPTPFQPSVWRLRKSDYAAIFQSSAAACRQDYAKEDRSASLSYCNLVLDPSCSPACRDFPSAKEAFAWFLLLNILQRNPTKTPHISELFNFQRRHALLTIRKHTHECGAPLYLQVSRLWASEHDFNTLKGFFPVRFWFLLYEICNTYNN